MEQARHLHEVHVSVHVLAVEFVELVRLAVLLHISPHDAHARQVFLHHGRECGELLLDFLEAPVNHPCEHENDWWEDHHGDQRVDREPRADPYHESQSEQEAHERVHRVHDGGPGCHTYGLGVVGGAGHEITGPRAAIEARVQPKEVRKVVVPQVALDAATETVEKLAHAILGGPPEKCGHYEEEGIGRNATHRHIRIAQAVDGQLDQIWPGHREEVGDDDQRQTRHGPCSVGPKVGEDGAEFVHPRDPSRVTHRVTSRSRAGHHPTAAPRPRGSDAAWSVPSGMTMMA